ncbi:MAG: hydrolase, partial [Clostridia bacterium]|nr:hydrolase [Clostridia bacterium]
KNVNADAIIAVYPFTPQPIITQALLMAADIPVFVGVGGGLTKGQRVINLAMFAEMQGATGVVLNAPTSNDIIKRVTDTIDIPTVITIASVDTDIDKRIESGADILNVSAAADTPRIVKKIRQKYPDVPIIATGGPSDDTIRQTIEAGANAITWTPPSNSEIFKDIMSAYRNNQPHP